MLAAGAGAGAMAALGLTGIREARAAAAPGRFNLAATPEALILRTALYDETVLQSFAFDNTNGHLYTIQVKNGAGSPVAGDLCVTKLSLTGTILGHMYLMGFGHGVQIGVEPSGSSAYLWTETDGASDGTNAWGRKLARFKFVNGQTLTTSSSALTKYAPVAGATSTTCAIDPSTNRLVMRYRLGGAVRYNVYALSAVKAGNATALFEVVQPSGLGTFQGYTAYGQYLYMLDGTAYSASNPNPGNTYLTSVDLGTGEVVQRSFTAAWKSLDYREPEGMALQFAAGQPRLCFGFASGAAGVRKANIIYKSALL
ncbi:phage baseplate protein [Sphaerisporangium perillae]|uniref:phage baseplate protein n=1 Tax=Sphaerisporangium perillae TaxID=2935860 RepID=UPI00200C5A5F|nr:teichoic acid biosynthesis protein C [Sphaerisporangium perillae]